MDAITVIGLLLFDQARVGLVDQGRGLEVWPGRSFAQMTVRDFMQFGIDERDQIVKRGFIAA